MISAQPVVRRVISRTQTVAAAKNLAAGSRRRCRKRIRVVISGQM